MFLQLKSNNAMVRRQTIHQLVHLLICICKLNTCVIGDVKVAVAWVLGAKVGVSGASLSKDYSEAVLALMCIYAAGFGWSWGPLSWLVPSEIFPMEIRAAGQSIAVAVNFAGTFVLAQTFLTMLCHFKFGTFLFYAGWITVMTAFVVLFLPETKGVPLDSMHTVWEKHWYWRRFVQETKPSQTT